MLATQSGAAAPRETKVDAAKCHACHVKRMDGAKCHLCHASATQQEGGCKQVPPLPCKTQVDVARSMVCDKVVRVCDEVACERWCATNLCVGKLCVCVCV